MSRRFLYIFFLPAFFYSSSQSLSAQQLVAQELVVDQGWLPACQTVPDNIEAGRAGRALVLSVASMSETFRQQCAALARATHVQVVLHLVGRLHTSTARAITEISRDADNELRAVMHVPIGHDSAELLAHEFEHVMEQVDGVCLRTLVANGAPGVSRSQGGSYETFRAKTAGRLVAAEVEATARIRQGARRSSTVAMDARNRLSAPAAPMPEPQTMDSP